jgi:hypothetical protein
MMSVIPRDSLVEVCGDFFGQLQSEYARKHAEKVKRSTTAGFYWKQRQRWYIADESEPDVRKLEIEMRLMSMVGDESHTIPLVDCKISTQIPLGVYSYNIFEDGIQVWEDDVFVHIHGEGPIDLTRLKPLSHEEIKSLTAPPEPPPPPPPPPAPKRTPRDAKDSASRLGLIVGKQDSAITLTNRYAYHAFHISHPIVIGRIESTIEVPDPRLPVTLSAQLFDATGHQVLAADLRGPNGRLSVQFDELRLKAGDYLLVWLAPSARGAGSYTNPHTGLFRDNRVPDQPLLDALIKEPPVADAFGQVTKIGLPQLKFFAD